MTGTWARCRAAMHLDGDVTRSNRIVDDKGEGMRFRLLVLGLVVLGLALAPATASAELVFDRGSDIYAAADDGSGVHLLVAAGWLGMDQGLASPAVAPSGDELLFWGETFQNASPDHGYTPYGANADGVYALAGGQLERLSAAPTAVRNPDGTQTYSSGDEAPEPAPGGGYVYEHTACSVYYNTGLQTWGDDCGTSLESAPLSQGSAGASQFASDCDVTGSSVQDPVADPAAGALRVAYGGCAYSADPGNPLVDPQAELVVSGPGQQGQVRVALGADTCCVAHPSAGFSDPSWSADGQRLVAYNAGGEHDTWNGSGFDTTSIPGGVYVYSDLSHTTAGTLALQAPSDDQGGYLRFSSPRFMGSDKIVFVAQGSVWSFPADCVKCSFPTDATKLYDGGSDPATQATGVAWTAGTIQPGSHHHHRRAAAAPATLAAPAPTPAASHRRHRRRQPTPPHVSIRSSRALVTAGHATISLACSSSSGPCSGVLSLSIKVTKRVRRRVHGHTRTVRITKTLVLARVRYSLSNGSTRSVVLRISRAGQRMLDHASNHQLHVLSTVTPSGGPAVERTIVVWLKTSDKHKKRA